MKKLFTLLAIFISFSSSYATIFNISATNHVFTPSALTIHRGDSVVWTNNGGTHNVHEDNGYFFSGTPDTGWVYGFRFDTIGSFHYQCDVHGSMGMQGTITVLETGVGIASLGSATNNLNQNYPNPFKTETNIQYSVSTPGTVIIEIYNMTGQKVRTLVDAFETAGQYSINWDATNDKGVKLPHGNYFYQMILSDQKYTKRMSVVE